MEALCKGRVAIVTGAGRGIGRGHALLLAKHGAAVVVNDRGGAADGSGASAHPADEVVAEIRAQGGAAVANHGDVTDAAACAEMVAQALAQFGRLDAVVNNAGFVRDRMFVNLDEEDWDAVIRVHLRGHFLLSREAARHFRQRQKAGEPLDARIINTSSGAGLLGSVGQAAYSAAKAGIAALTLVQAAELGRYGVTANAIAPAARTRMTETTFAEMMRKPEQGFDAMAPENIAPLVVWLVSSLSAGVNGQVFEMSGAEISVAEGWRTGPSAKQDRRWEPAALDTTLRRLLAETRPPQKVYGT
jgi:NAD(P)-dependent dehydrogenase (short-subunit alcohol dehydrogenase family)